MEQAPCLSTEAKEEKPTSPGSSQLPCACDVGSLIPWLIIIIADIHQVLTLCQIWYHLLYISLLLKALQQSFYYYAHCIDGKTEAQAE